MKCDTPVCVCVCVCDGRRYWTYTFFNSILTSFSIYSLYVYCVCMCVCVHTWSKKVRSKAQWKLYCQLSVNIVTLYSYTKNCILCPTHTHTCALIAIKGHEIIDHSNIGKLYVCSLSHTHKSNSAMAKKDDDDCICICLYTEYIKAERINRNYYY